MARVTLDGNPFETNGELPAVGERAPDFRLVDGDLQDVGLATFAGRKKILNIVPSLETSTCATTARRFNERTAAMDGVVTLVISADLPFAQVRFCTTEGLDGVVPLSMLRSKNFAKDYGVLLTDGPFEGLSARAVVVLDDKDEVVYTQLVSEIADEPDYAAAIAAVS
ncbi:MAG: thiol peroxidase [bacterium]|nr:thiol peroxidase [bacterium]